jgi:GNAT superfamily N-acetyltransferase
MRILSQQEQFPWRVAAPTKIPPMNYDENLFHKQLRQLVYSDQEIAGVPERANTIHCQGGSTTGSNGDYSVFMSFIHHDENGAPNGILHYFPEGSRSAKEKPGGVQVMVHPAHQGKGIGSKLLDEAMNKYGPNGSDALSDWEPIDLEKQNTTPSGYGLYEKYQREQGKAT